MSCLKRRGGIPWSVSDRDFWTPDDRHWVSWSTLGHQMTIGRLHTSLIMESIMPCRVFLRLGGGGCFRNAAASSPTNQLPIMHWQSSPFECRLACPWAGTENCVACKVSPDQFQIRQLSLGVMCGLKAFYFPHALPPCLGSNGTLNLERPAESRSVVSDAGDWC